MATVTTPVRDTALASTSTPEIVPIIIDLGKEKRKRIKALKRGRGKLMLEVAAVINDAQLNLGGAADGKEIIPIVLIYKQKRKKRRAGGLTLPLPFPLLG